jgi:hypothetical protein
MIDVRFALMPLGQQSVTKDILFGIQVFLTQFRTASDL